MSTAIGNVLLNISTGKVDFASIQGFKNMMQQAVGAVADFVKKNDEYVDALQKMSVNIGSATRATGNLIESTKLMQTTARLTQAGVDLTEESFRNLAVAAADMGEITGDASGALDSLTSAMISGNERGLRPYGISLDGCNTLAEKQASIMKQLKEKYGDVEVQADTLSDSVNGISNAFSDLIGSIWAEFTTKSTGIISILNNVAKSASMAAESVRRFGLAFTVVNAAKAGAYLTLEDKKAKAAADIAQKQADADRAQYDMIFPQEEVDAFNSKKKKSGSGGGGRSETKQAEALSYFEAQDRGLYGGPENYASGYATDIGSEIGLYTNETPLGIEKNSSAAMEEEAAALIKLDEEKKKIEDRAEEYRQRRMGNLEKDREFQLTYAEEFKMSWSKSMSTLEHNSMLAGTANQMLTGSINMVANAINGSAKGSVRAWASMIRGIALQTAIQASVQGIMETANAAVDFARENYAGGAEHTAAAVVNYATAAVAASVAAGATFIAKAAGGGHKKPSPHHGNAAGATSKLERGAGVPGGGPPAGVGGGNVTVVLEGDAGGVFRVAQKGSRQAAANGDRSFSEG